MRVALISDLHGNVPALDAVLASIREHGVDEIVCLGDTATLGSQPREVLARLQELGCVCILGNHDAFLLDADLVHSYSEVKIVVDAVEWSRAQLKESDLDFVRTFVAEYEIQLGPAANLLMFHGTPRSNMEDLLCTTPEEELDRMLEGHVATVMACGHTHVQMLRQHRSMLLVNPGSVGMPFKEYVSGRAPTIMPYAEWACVEANAGGVAVTLRRVPVDTAKLLAPHQGSSNPMAAALIAEYAAASSRQIITPA
jgi:putative phosphoesterase